MAVGECVQIPCHVALSVGCLNLLMMWQLTLPRMSDQRETQTKAKTEVVVFHILIWKMTHHHLAMS